MVPERTYWRIAEMLRDQILSGRLTAAHPLPSERYLAGQYETTGSTMRRALDVLEGEGLITRAGGALTRIRALPTNRETVEVPHGARVRTRRATSGERSRLGLAAGEWVIEVAIGRGRPEIYGAERVTLHIRR